MNNEEKCIYKATNLIDRKVYIGQTNNLERRIREHRSHAQKDGGPFHEAILKFGIQAFKFEILEWCRSDVVDDKERFYIALFRDNLGPENVYNICEGGLGGQTHDVSGFNNLSYRKSYSEEERLQMSMKLKGKKKPDGFGEKVSKALKGKPKSREQVLKKSHPISVINSVTGEILHFSSKAEMQRTIKCDLNTLLKGRTSRNGYRLYKEKIAVA